MPDNQPLATVPDGAGLNIVLFGMPGSGKSALLGALYQAAQTQTEILGAKITDTTGTLAELHQRLYAHKPNPPLQEVSAYPITVEPAGDSEVGSAVLVDCDGRVAQEFLTQNQNLEGAKGTLARAILHADALIVPIDPTAGTAQIEKDLGLLCQFIHTLEQLRSKRNEVAGLPVFFVLTKCDLFSKTTDATSAWMTRVDEGKRKLDKRLQEFLAKIPRRDALAFGKVDVHMFATAIKRPQLADRPAKAHEPYGVAELFRQCFQAARSFHLHRQEAQGWLQTVVMSFLGLVLFMALVAAFFYLTRPAAELTALEGKIQNVIPGQNKDEWFRGASLDERLKNLKEIHDDPYFDKLPAEMQQRVTQAEQEIETYQKLNQQFFADIQLPRFAKDKDDLDKIEKSLKDLAIPPAYLQDWSQTPLVKKQQQMLKDVQGLREAVTAENAWFKDQIKEGQKLRTQGGAVLAGTVSTKDRDVWFQKVQDFLTRPARYRETDPLANAPTITYATVYRFRSVEQTRNELKTLQDILINLRKAVP